MENITFYAPGNHNAIEVACQVLSNTFHIARKPAPDVTHLLLPVPSFESDGRIRGGGVLENILADLREDVTVIGGNLQHPALLGLHTIDLLRDREYVARNAVLTADCALRIAGEHLKVAFADCPVLVVGWGRIGKCLAATLKNLGANVSVAVRNPEYRALLRAMGYGTEDTHTLNKEYRVIWNTAPGTVLQNAVFPKGVIKIDLASVQGLAGKDVIIARGLPGKMVPESSGKLIADRVLAYLEQKEEKV